MIAAFIFGMGVMAVLGMIYALVFRFQSLPAPTKETKLIERILSVLFPPHLPSQVIDWDDRAESWFDERGSAGNVKKHYRDGIDRFWSEHDAERRTKNLTNR